MKHPDGTTRLGRQEVTHRKYWHSGPSPLRQRSPRHSFYTWVTCLRLISSHNVWILLPFELCRYDICIKWEPWWRKQDEAGGAERIGDKPFRQQRLPHACINAPAYPESDNISSKNILQTFLSIHNLPKHSDLQNGLGNICGRRLPRTSKVSVCPWNTSSRTYETVIDSSVLLVKVDVGRTNGTWMR